MQGVVKFWTPKMWGFINGQDGQSYFFHISGVMGNRSEGFQEGQEVNFDVDRNEKGLYATNVRKVTEDATVIE
jgi:CspA family cold shock protein